MLAVTMHHPYNDSPYETSFPYLPSLSPAGLGNMDKSGFFAEFFSELSVMRMFVALVPDAGPCRSARMTKDGW